MQYQVGDQVVHVPHGLGRVIGLVNNSVGDLEPKLYYEISLGKSTVWVPVQKSASLELRALTLKSDLERYRHVLRSKPVKLSINHRQRHTDLVDMLKSGTFEGLCIVVRDLTAQGQIKALNHADALTLRHTHENLTREWAAAEEIALHEADRQIQALIFEGRLA